MCVVCGHVHFISTSAQKGQRPLGPQSWDLEEVMLCLAWVLGPLLSYYCLSTIGEPFSLLHTNFLEPRSRKSAFDLKDKGEF